MPMQILRVLHNKDQIVFCWGSTLGSCAAVHLQDAPQYLSVDHPPKAVMHVVTRDSRDSVYAGMYASVDDVMGRLAW